MASAKVLCWKMAIQEYDFDISHVAGVDNIVADAMSRIPVYSEEDATAELNGLKNMIIVPTEHADNISRAHNSLTGHGGVDDTLHKLDQLELKWFGRRKHVRHFIKQCPICQKLSYQHEKVYTERYMLSTSRPMERVNIDSIGPLLRTYGFKRKLIYINSYILAIIDTDLFEVLNVIRYT
jgi:hypothetical protein